MIDDKLEQDKLKDVNLGQDKLEEDSSNKLGQDQLGQDKLEGDKLWQDRTMETSRLDERFMDDKLMEDNPSWLKTISKQISNVRIAFLILSIFSIIQVMTKYHLYEVLLTLKKRFDLSIHHTNTIAYANEFTHLCFIIPISYLATRRSKSFILCLGGFGIWISCLFHAFPFFIFGSKTNIEDIRKMPFNLLKSNYELCSFNGTENQELPLKKVKKSVKYVTLIFEILGGLINGASSCTFWNVGASLVDDLSGDKGGFFLGLLMAVRDIAQVLAHCFSHLTLQFYESLTGTSYGIPDGQNNPEWVGSWWLGWIILGFAILLVCPFVHEIQENIPKYSISSLDRSVVMEKELKFMEMTNIIVDFLKNFVYLFLLIGLIFEIISLIFIFCFLPVYFYFYFRVDLNTSALYSVIIIFVSETLGTLISASMGFFFHFSTRQMNLFNVGAHTASGMVMFLLFIHHCTATAIVGVNFRMNTKETSCQSQCNCNQLSTNNKYTPICFNNKTYYSPCDAGCIKRINETTFGGCGCENGFAFLGQCELMCNTVYGFVIVLFISKVIGAMSRVQCAKIMMRQSTVRNKPLALAPVVVLFSFIGLLASNYADPLFDYFCSIKNKKNDELIYGVYNSKILFSVFNGFPLAMKLIACVFYLISWYYTDKNKKGY